ncbi:GntR family transcriptional regulator [Paremcibacter congregatus]|uniref:GntR family transcriptional regulator n=1 Tax=Paremcibacter congregatus TaxID=2043170 RepID=UPI0030ED1CEB
MNNKNVTKLNEKQRVTPTSKVEKAVHHLITGIHAGHYAPGQRLVESDLTQEIGISRGPLREALKILAAKDMLDLAPNRGARIKRLQREDLHQRFQLLETLGTLAIEGLPDQDKKTLQQNTPYPLQTEKSNVSLTSDHSPTILALVVNYYCHLAYLGQNSLLADYIFKLNLTYFAPHIMRTLDVNVDILEKQFSKVKDAILQADTLTAQKAHQNWCRQVLEATHLLPASTSKQGAF